MQVATGDYAGAVATLEAELCNHGNQELGVPHLDFPQLQQAVQESTDEGVKERMKVSGRFRQQLGARAPGTDSSLPSCLR